MNIKKLFLYTLIGSVSVSALLGIIVILFGNFGDLEVRVLMSTLTITATSILGLACGAYYETGRGRNLPRVGIALTLGAAVMTFLIIWNVFDDNKTFVKASATMMMLAVTASHLSLLSIARLDRRFAWSRIAAFVFDGLLVGILIFLLWFEPEGDNELVSKTIGVLSILVATVTVITPVFHRLSHPDKGTTEIDAEIAELKAKIEELEAKKAAMSTDKAAGIEGLD